MQRRQSGPVRRRASGDTYERPENATPATQIEPEALKASRLPRQMQRRQSDPVRRRASADIYEGPESATPATQIGPEVLKASRLPRKMHSGVNPTQFVAELPRTSMKNLKAPRLPRKSSLRR